jgi:NAD(P)-dependent dehydrogenase (short-subunit alcohol dehydrogenase family)
MFDVESAELDETRLQGFAERPTFTGEIGLVTGAASGIGRACAASLLARGAAVVGLDINPTVGETFDGAGYLGLQCDVTDEEAVCQALETAVRRFGGLDMLIPNAGLFPPGCRIDALSVADWDKVMRVNLDANLVLMREAYPLLKASPRGGRVVVMGSRNVPAPGPGAVAYSASKAALVQMARVAALEWGKDGIRVNIINPHAVFDTGIWTDEVLQARADYYGLTVDEYKKNNVLRVEIKSRDVGELVAEMCGPLFAKTTGAQVPIDGGSNRVI